MEVATWKRSLRRASVPPASAARVRRGIGEALAALPGFFALEP